MRISTGRLTLLYIYTVFSDIPELTLVVIYPIERPTLWLGPIPGHERSVSQKRVTDG